VIEVRYRARLGNRMFQYCLGRILAEELGFVLQAEDLPGFPNTAQKIEGLLFQDPVQILAEQPIDLDAVRADRSPRRIILEGWFQRYEYYRPWRRKIQQWLTIDPAVRRPDFKPHVVVHVRRTDYVQQGWALPFSYYDQAIETLLPHGGDIWIVTDDSRDPFFRKFADRRPKFFRGTPLEAMLFMSCSSQLVMSQSTFSWWPTFLGEVERVVCPLPQFGAWSGTGDHLGLNLIERDRFICLPCEKADQPTRIEAIYQRWRRYRRRLILRANRKLHLSLDVPLP
jgi:hypothetical protein